ncbi:MAG: hypothetical protein AB8B48_11740 [Pseudomonadales bacterium]
MKLTIPIAIRLKSENRDYYRDVFSFLAGVLLISFSLSISSNAFSFDIQHIEHPPLTSLTWVGERIEHNGMPMQILQLNSELSTSELFGFYKEIWQPMHAENQRATIERSVGEWQIISTLLDNHNIVVQVRPSPIGLEGFMSATPLDEAPVQSEIARHFPKQWGTELVSSTQSQDGGVQATTLVLKNTHSLESTHEFYTRTMQANGWTLSHQNTQLGGSVLFFDNKDGAVEMAIRRENSNTVIFANVRGEGV